MASIREIHSRGKRKQTKEQKFEQLSSLFLLLAVCDNYILSKSDKGVRLVAYKNILSTEIDCKDEYDLVQRLGDWLVSLPKGVW